MQTTRWPPDRPQERMETQKRHSKVVLGYAQPHELSREGNSAMGRTDQPPGKKSSKASSTPPTVKDAETSL